MRDRARRVCPGFRCAHPGYFISTGPHLHYETRIDGEAVDPQKFLRAGLRLGNAL